MNNSSFAILLTLLLMTAPLHGEWWNVIVNHEHSNMEKLVTSLRTTIREDLTYTGTTLMHAAVVYSASGLMLYKGISTLHNITTTDSKQKIKEKKTSTLYPYLQPALALSLITISSSMLYFYRPQT